MQNNRTFLALKSPVFLIVSEFSDVVNGMNINDVLTVIEELMETLRVANSSTGRLYNATLRRLKDI